MSIIQDIRDKYARVTVVLIALALIGFILTDYFQGKARSAGGSSSNTIGTVNGRSITYDDFMSRLEMTKQQMKSQGYPAEQADIQAPEQTWNQEIGRLLLEDELDKLGITVSKKEMGDVLYGPNAPQDLKQQFTDSVTGQYDGVKAKQAIDNMLKSKQTPPEQKIQFNNYIDGLREQRKQDKYLSLITNTINVPRWFVEKQNADASQMARISYVNESYTAVSDSSVKVEDKMIADYINKHKEMFRQEESRGISFVSFSASPSTADSLAAKNKVSGYKAEFDTTADAGAFLAKYGNSLFDGYIGASQMQIAAKDSVQRLSKNQIYGPYLDGNSYVLAKMLDTKVLPDSVKCRHVLVSTDVQNGGYADSVASKKIDSIKNAISGGAVWGDMVEKYNPASDGSRQNKGEMTFSSTDIQGENFAKEFGQFILFDGKPGERKVVKTSFGYHYIEIMSFIKPENHYKVAYLFQEISASKETISTAQGNAAKFASESKDIKTFDAAYEKDWKPKGYLKSSATNIGPSSQQAGSAGTSRGFVLAIYKASLGEVLQPEKINNNYVVAVVTEVEAEGTMSVSKARMYVEPMLKNKKKAEVLKQKIGKVSTLEAAAATLGGKQVIAADSIRMTGQTNPTLGYEPKISGAAFNPANKGKVVPEVLEGVNGVYVVRVEDVTTTPVTNGDVASQRKAKADQQKQALQNPQSPANPLNALRNAATIKDKRSRRM